MKIAFCFLACLSFVSLRADDLPEKESAALGEFAHFPSRESAHLEYRELARSPREGGVCGQLTTTASANEGPFCLTVRSFTVDRRYEGLSVGEGNQLLDNTGTRPFLLNLVGVAWGEPVYLSLVGKSKTARADLVLIPFPIQRGDATGHQLLLVRSDIYGSTFRLRGSGYNPREPLTLTIFQDDQRQVNEIHAYNDGCFETLLSFEVDGQDGGMAVVTVEGEESSVSIAYDWGARIFAHGG
jgi:hypothetical protein